jgi:hypothetical protein
MSAFIVSDLHTFTIAAFAAGRLRLGSHFDRDQLTQDLANKLKRANVDSVNFRYAEKTPRTKCKPQAVTITEPAQVYRLARCWIYQACENQHNADFHALSALIDAAFTQDEKRASDNVDIWII